MSEQEIIEGNKLIAEFISKEFNLEYGYLIGNEWFDLKQLKFHSSCDWLIPIFEKIQYINNNNSEFFEEYYNIDFKIDLLNGVDFKIDKKRIFMQTAFGPGQLINAVWSGIVAFIKWFNKNKLCRNN